MYNTGVTEASGSSDWKHSLVIQMRRSVLISDIVAPLSLLLDLIVVIYDLLGWPCGVCFYQT